MRSGRSIVWLATSAVVLVVLVIWFGKGRPAATLSPVVAESNPTLSAQNAPTEPGHPAATSSAQAVAPPGNVPTAASFGTSPGESKAEQVLNVLSNYNDMPIVYYGKLEDQFGTPVVEAAVDFTIRVINGYESTTKRGRVASDTAGLFTISGYKGQDLSVSPQKAGYALASGDRLANYSHLFPEEERAQPDSSSPVVIRMWKLQGGEHLVSFGIQMDIPIKGIPVFLDLQTGRRVESGGDVSISIESSPEPNVREQYDWRAVIRAVNGGIVECSGVGLERMFEAPNAGYRPELDINRQKGTQAWAATFNGGFYFTSRTGQCYGKCSLQISTYRVQSGAVPVTLRGYLNPAGSRDLENRSRVDYPSPPMKLRRSVGGFAVMVAVFIVLVIWRGGKPIKAPLTENTAVWPSQPAAAPPAQTSSPLANIPTPANEGRPPGESKAEQVVNVLSNYNDMPIVYYGKLEDQFGSPVAGAAVNFSVRVINGYETTTKRGSIASDVAGCFAISGQGTRPEPEPEETRLCAGFNKRLGQLLSAIFRGGASASRPEQPGYHQDVEVARSGAIGRLR